MTCIQYLYNNDQMHVNKIIYVQFWRNDFQHKIFFYIYDFVLQLLLFLKDTIWLNNFLNRIGNFDMLKNVFEQNIVWF